VDPLFAPALIILPLPVHVAATKFGWREPSLLKLKNISLGSRYVGLPIQKKFSIKVFLTVALLLATTPFWAGAADRHQTESAGLVEIGRFYVRLKIEKKPGQLFTKAKVVSESNH